LRGTIGVSSFEMHRFFAHGSFYLFESMFLVFLSFIPILCSLNLKLDCFIILQTLTIVEIFDVSRIWSIRSITYSL